MKKVLALTLAALMALGMLAGCSKSTTSGGTDGTGTGSEDVTYLNEYKSTFTSPIKSMNPYTTTGTSDYYFTANLVEGLVETDKYGMVSPCLAESWEHNDDYTVWTFHLRPDVYWVDCTGAKTEYKVTADDFVAGIRYVSDPANDASNFSTIRGVISGLEDYYYRLVDLSDGKDIGMTAEQAKATFDTDVGVKALDETTVEYTLSGPYSYFLAYAQLDLMVPVEQAFLDTVGTDYGIAKDKLLYNGGYYVSDWELDKQVVMKKNPEYWDLDNIHVDTLSWEYVSDGISSLELFERGDITETKLGSEEVASVRGTDWEKDVYLSDKTVTTYWYSFNFATKNPEVAAAVNNENFRKAIFTAIDAVTLSAVWEPENPEFFCRYTLLPENAMFDADGKDYTDYDGLKEYKENNPFNADTAKDYMKKAVAELCEADGVTLKGVTGGDVDMLPVASFKVDGKLPIDIVYSSGSSESEMKKATLVKQMLETYLGTEYVYIILGYSSNSFSADVYDLNNWDLVDDAYGMRYGDPSANLNRCTSDYDITYSSYNIPEYDEMVAAADKIYDINDRYAAYAKAECWLLDHAYIKPYLSGGGTYKMTRIVPFTIPGGSFGLGQYKMKGALIQENPITSEQYDTLKTQYEKERSAQKSN